MVTVIRVKKFQPKKCTDRCFSLIFAILQNEWQKDAALSGAPASSERTRLCCEAIGSLALWSFVEGFTSEG